MTYLVAGFIAVCVIALLVEMWQALEADWGCEMNEGKCGGKCLRQPCPTTWECGQGAKQ